MERQKEEKFPTSNGNDSESSNDSVDCRSRKRRLDLKMVDLSQDVDSLRNGDVSNDERSVSSPYNFGYSNPEISSNVLNKNECAVNIFEKSNPVLISLDVNQVECTSNVKKCTEDFSFNLNKDKLGSNLAENFNIPSPAKNSFHSIFEMNENILHKSGATSPSASSFGYNSEINKNEFLSNVLHEPSSESSVDSTLDTHPVETVSMTANKLSLPYFHLPNPDFDTFLIETERRLNMPEINTRSSSFPRRTFQPKDKGDIVFEVDSDDASKSNIRNNKNAASCSDYQRVLFSIDKLDDSKSPGIKRLMLKDYLKNKIEEKKVLAFQRVKELEKLNNEMDNENDETMFDSSEEDIEEATVSFNKEQLEDYELNDFHADSQKISNHSDVKIDDDDNFGVPRARKVRILKEDSSDESSLDCAAVKARVEKYFAEATDLDCQDCLSHPADCPEYSPSQKVKKYNDSTDSWPPPEEYPEYSPTNNVEKYDDKHDSTDSWLPPEEYPEYSPTNNVEKYDDKHDFGESSGKEISSSIPSYQPGGGFNLEEDEDFDNMETKISESLQIPNKYLIDKVSDTSELNTPILAKVENDSPMRGLFLHDPPISQPENRSDYFSTQELVDVCSGVFKGSTHHETRSKKESNKIHELDEGSREKIQDFFDVEAELSGDEDGADDEEDNDSDNAHDELDLVDDCELPAEEVLRDEIADLHMKRIRDDDDELLKDLQEKFLDDGELNNYGTGRTRRFAWLNSDAADAFSKPGRDSSSDSDEAPDDAWSSMNREKAKWRQEKEDDLMEEMSSNYKKPHLKLNIIGRPEFAKSGRASNKPPSCKRPRGSFLYLDQSEASQVLKKLKTSEDTHGGSRTTKHFVFRNDLPSNMTSKRRSRDSNLINDDHAGPSGSVFNNI